MLKSTEGPFSAASGFFDSGKGKDLELALGNGLKAVANYLEDQERRFPEGQDLSFEMVFSRGYMIRILG